MPRVDSEVNILPSILDRLLDDEPDRSEEPLSRRFQDLEELKISVRRDLEALLNTRQEMLAELPPEYTEIRRSLLTYGLPDFTALSVHSAHDRNRMRRSLEQAIAAFEPRLTRVRLTLEPPQRHDQVLRFRIEALLQVEPNPEPVTFDAALQLQTQQYTVQGHD